MLAVQGLTKHFGGFTAVDDVHFELEKGEILGLIGPNGSGKSTIFNMLSGALKPNAGSILLDGKEIGGVPPHEICGMGVGRTFQIPRPIRRLTILENAALAGFYGHAGPVSREEAWRNAAEALELVGPIAHNRIQDRAQSVEVANPHAELVRHGVAGDARRRVAVILARIDPVGLHGKPTGLAVAILDPVGIQHSQHACKLCIILGQRLRGGRGLADHPHGNRRQIGHR